MVDLFDWEEQEAEIDLSGSGIELFDEVDRLEMDGRDAEEILADWYGVKPKNIVVIHGSQEGVFLTYMALKPREVYIPLPSYPPIFEQAEALGIKVSFTGLEPDVEGSTLALANPNNPTGYYIDLDKMVDNNLIIVDEIFKLYVDEDQYIHPNVIIVSSTSKFFGFKDRKVGWIIADERYIHRIRLTRDLVSPTPIYDSILVKYIFKNYDFFRERSLDIVKRNIKILREDLDYFDIEYNPLMPIALLVKEDLDSMVFCRGLLNKKNVLLTPSDYFGVKNGIRISLGRGDPEMLEEALRRLNQYIKEYQ